MGWALRQLSKLIIACRWVVHCVGFASFSKEWHQGGDCLLRVFIVRVRKQDKSRDPDEMAILTFLNIKWNVAGNRMNSIVFHGLRNVDSGRAPLDNANRVRINLERI